MKNMNISQFARHINVSRTRVYSYIESGMIPGSCIVQEGRSRKIKVNPAMKALKNSLDPARAQRANVGNIEPVDESGGEVFSRLEAQRITWWQLCDTFGFDVKSQSFQKQYGFDKDEFTLKEIEDKFNFFMRIFDDLWGQIPEEKLGLVIWIVQLVLATIGLPDGIDELIKKQRKESRQ